MNDVTIYDLLAVPAAYLLGAVPFSFILGRLAGKTDLRLEGDGHVSATAVYRLLGLNYFLVAVILDVGKGALAVFIAWLISDWQVVILAAGFAAVAGHCWSVYIRFKGGLGATVIYGVLASLAIDPFLIAGATGGLIFYFIRKSTLGTVIIIVLLSLVLLICGKDLLMILFPYSLLGLQFIKRWQITRRKSSPEYTMDFTKDFKRK